MTILTLMKMLESSPNSLKETGIGRNCSLFSKDLHCRHVKSRACLGKGLPFSKRHILDSSKLKELADNKFKFEKNGRKLSKCVENTVGKGEIARY